jgi:hypothetical protein
LEKISNNLLIAIKNYKSSNPSNPNDQEKWKKESKDLIKKKKFYENYIEQLRNKYLDLDIELTKDDINKVQKELVIIIIKKSTKII